MQSNNKNWRIWLRAVGQVSVCLGAAMVGLIWLSISFHLTSERERSEQAAIQNSGNLARSFEEHLTRLIENVDRSLLTVRANYQKDPAAFDLTNWSKDTHLIDSAAIHIGIIGPDGMLKINSAGLLRSPVDLSKTPNFRFHSNAGSDELFISEPMIGRVSGKWSIQVSRPLHRPDGSFDGVIGMALDPYYFVRFYDSIDLGPNGYVAIVGSDGIIRAVGGRTADTLGRGLVDTQLWRRSQSAPAGWYFSNHTESDGVRRLVSYRTVKDVPLMIKIGIADQWIFAESLSKKRSYSTVATLMTLLILLVMGLSISGRVKLERTRGTLVAQNTWFDVALNNMRQGLLMFDSRSRLVLHNQRFLQMYGLSPDNVKPGCTLRDLLRLRKAAGTFAGDPDKYATKFVDRAGNFREDPDIAKFADEGAETKLTELPDGRAISITNQAMPGGGWVSTHDDVTERKRADERIAYLAHHDALTDLPNRVRFQAQLEQALGRVRQGERIAVLYLDLDHFKRINDTLGHPVGDALLTAVADRLRSCLAEIDTIARLGGDEFAIIHSVGAQPTEIADLVDRIYEVIRAPYDLGGHQVIADVSIGIASAPDHGTESNELLKNADLALYGAKSAGRGISRFFEPEMDARMKARRSLEVDLRKALASGELELYYQPVVNLQRNEISGCEALLRWRHPERGMILPADFLPVAEETGLIVPIGEWVLRQACADAATWPGDVKVAVNLSPAQFRNQTVTPAVVSSLAASGLPPDRLELEITESGLMQNNEATVGMLHQLRDLGVHISMDDFGTEYSSLTYLRSFPFDKIKIDRSFINGLPNSTESLTIVRAIVSLANGLDMATTAEGVETEQQLEDVRAAGCTEMQGYLFSPPRPAEEIARLFFSRAESAARAASAA